MRALELPLQIIMVLVIMSMMPQSVVAEAGVRETIGSIERLAPAMDALVPADAVIEVIADGFDWAEGPVWVPSASGGFLLFSDAPRNTVYRWTPGTGIDVYLNPSGYFGPTPRPDHVGADETGSNGLMLDPEGRLVLCQHGERQVARMDAPLDQPASRFIPLANRFEGKRFNSPNDLVFHRNGDLYFTDPPYGLAQRENDPAREMDYQGIFRVMPTGEVTLLSRELSRPNGIAFSPDYRTLYVANSDGARPIWMAFPVLDDGTLGPGRVFKDMTVRPKGRKGGQDGMCVDRDGNLFATGPGGVMVMTAQGEHLGTLLTGLPTSNCTFGEDGSTLFISADMKILRVRLTTRGMGF